MKKSQFCIKNLFIILAIIVSLFFANCVALLFNLNAFATTEYYGKNNISVTNGNFTDYTTNKNNLPYTIDTGWSKIAGLNSNNVTTGIIDTDINKFKDNGNFTLPTNPETDEAINPASKDNYVLMIKANSDATKFGYTSSSVTLNKSKYYVISVHCKTGLLDNSNNLIANTEATASIYTSLPGNPGFSNINTNGAWKTYKLFVATNSFEDSTVTIDLRLGDINSSSKGVVFFDQIEILEVANLDYFSSQENSLTEKRISLNNNVITGFTNANFENDLNGWTLNDNTGLVSVKTKNSINETIKELENETKNYADAYLFNDTKSLLIVNNNSYASLKSADNNFINIKQHGYYRLSVLVKTSKLSSGGLNITLNEIVESGEPITASKTSVTSSDGSEAFNGFKKVEFLIKSNALRDSKVGISFEFGTSENPLTGWAIIEDIVLEKISQKIYSDTTNDSSLDLSKNIKATSTVKNASFDFIKSSVSDIIYPASPADWVINNEESNSGIIRINSKLFNIDCVNYGLDSSNNPGPNTSYSVYKELGLILSAETANDNVLMVTTNSNEDTYFKTNETFNLTTNQSSQTINTIEVGVKTLGNSKAFIKLVDENDNLIAVIDNISANEWTNYSVFIKNGISSSSVNLILGAHGTNENNYVFFDHVKYTEDNSLTKENVLKVENSCYVDLIEDSFYSHSNNENNNAYVVPNWSTFNTDEGKLSALYSGVVSTSQNPTEIKARENANDKNMLVIANTVASYQLFNTNYTYSLLNGNYYEISVWIRTDFINCENQEKFGASFEIVNYDKEKKEIVLNDKNKNKFTNIVTNDNTNYNWVKYSIFVLAEKDEDVKLLIGLGTQELPTQGKAYFDDISVKEITIEEYAKATANNTTIVSTSVSLPEENKNNNSNNTSNNNTANTEMNFFALFSSIILVVALVLAIAGVIIRRIPKKHVENKVEKSEYSKTPKQVNEKEVKEKLKQERELKLSEISAELEKLNLQKTELQEKYKKESEQEENVTVKEKLYKTYTKELNKLVKEIEYLESAVVFANDAVNIKNMENNEIKNKQKELDKEFLELKKKEEEDKEEKTTVNKKSKKSSK